MKSMEIPKLNKSAVVFDHDQHRYWLGDKELRGITSTLIKRAYPDTYKDVPKFVLKKAAENGSRVHAAIELYEEFGLETEIPEFYSYKQIKEENGFFHLASEYIVSDEQNYASAIDHVYVCDGKIILVDIKRTSVLHEDNVSLQLSIYKKFFEMQNPHLKVSSIAVIWLHGDDSKLKYLPVVEDKVLEELIEADLNDNPYAIAKNYGDLPAIVADVEHQIETIVKRMKADKELYDSLTSGLLSVMSKHDIKKYTGSIITLTKINEQKRMSFDSKRFSSEHPELYSSYMKETLVKESLKISVKNYG